MIIYVTFETEFSAHGGLGAVMKLLPKALGGEACAVVAPFFRRLIQLERLKRAGTVESVTALFTFQAVIRGQSFPVEVIEVVNRMGLKLFFLSSAEFFNAPENPYVNPSNPEAAPDPYRNPINGEKLTEDSLFFSIVAPVAIVELCKAGRLPARELVLHLQDWETAAVAPAVHRTQTAPALRSVKCVLTIHNPYDKTLQHFNSARVCDFAAHLGFKLQHSILEQAIPLLDAPVSTVSAGFARELRNEVLYTQVFCSHLQVAFRDRGLVGVDNGIFGPADFPFTADAHARALAGDFSVLQAEKWAKRMQLADVMRRFRAELDKAGSATTWGTPPDLEDPAVPVFFLLGRDDPRQKGFDVMAEAIRAQPRGAARYLFSILPGDEGLMGLDFLRRLAGERPGEVCVFPFRMDTGIFNSLRQGGSFLVMGSLYEPFGAVNEGYLAGMPVVARATGGLVQQVVPDNRCLADEGILSVYGRQLVREHHGTPGGPSGILFREQASFVEEVEGWHEIVQCPYWEQNPKGDRLESRRDIPLFRKMVQSAAAALRLAAEIYADQPRYAAMIFNGWGMLSRFQWQRSIEEYRRHLYQPAQGNAAP